MYPYTKATVTMYIKNHTAKFVLHINILGKLLVLDLYCAIISQTDRNLMLFESSWGNVFTTKQTLLIISFHITQNFHLLISWFLGHLITPKPSYVIFNFFGCKLIYLTKLWVSETTFVFCKYSFRHSRKRRLISFLSFFLFKICKFTIWHFFLHYSDYRGP